jgi:molybdopterin-biosynthesis enzyme MoeA-like protein
MASSGKKKTTMAKLDRERRMREKRMDKQARKDARKQASAAGLTNEFGDAPLGGDTAEPSDVEAPELVRS